MQVHIYIYIYTLYIYIYIHVSSKQLSTQRVKCLFLCGAQVFLVSQAAWLLSCYYANKLCSV